MRKITLKEAENFHGHLGPWLVLGILAGELAIKKLKCKKYFGLDIRVWGASQKPKSCLIDGLQLSTGATYGKGNIQKLNGNKIQILFRKAEDKAGIRMSLKEEVSKRLGGLKGHRDSEIFAQELYKTNILKIFNLTTND